MLRLLGLAFCLSQIGCSALLDFSDNAIPKDAPQDIFTIAECTFKEPNDTFETAVAHAAGEPAMAALCADGFQDKDFYKITVPAATMSLTVGINFTNTGGDLDLHLYDATGVELAFSAGNLDNEKIVCPGTAPVCMLGNPAPIPEGDYVFEVRSLANVQNTYTIDVVFGM